MVLVDKKILAGGIAMMIAGVILVLVNAESPVGQSGMTEEEIIDLMIAEDENQAYQMLSGILVWGFRAKRIIFFRDLIWGSGRRRKRKRYWKREMMCMLMRAMRVGRENFPERMAIAVFLAAVRGLIQ